MIQVLQDYNISIYDIYNLLKKKPINNKTVTEALHAVLQEKNLDVEDTLVILMSTQQIEKECRKIRANTLYE